MGLIKAEVESVDMWKIIDGHLNSAWKDEEVLDWYRRTNTDEQYKGTN